MRNEKVEASSTVYKTASDTMASVIFGSEYEKDCICMLNIQQDSKSRRKAYQPCRPEAVLPTVDDLRHATANLA